MPRKRRSKGIHNVVVVSDTHSGCQMALCPPESKFDGGGGYELSKLQKKLWAMWEEFWGEFVPSCVNGEPYAVVHNGDAIDGRHHHSTTQITQNLKDQRKIAKALLRPVIGNCDGRYYHIRGTDAHVGQTAEDEEELAEDLNAIPDQEGHHARADLWLQVGGGLVHLLHHIGSTGSLAYETTAVMKELSESMVEAARWGRRPPDMIVRSHRHRYVDLAIPTSRGKARAVVTPCWQGKTPFAWKIPGARLATPMFGGIVICWAEESQTLFVREKVWTVEPSPVVVLEA